MEQEPHSLTGLTVQPNIQHANRIHRKWRPLSSDPAQAAAVVDAGDRCDLESEVKLNVGKLDSDWGINGKTLRSVLLRNPKVLGYNVDCRGDCAAQCTRCWVRF
nr:uncharacterized protein LOC109774654 [Aegilops tauschii subsp. strangulata]